MHLLLHNTEDETMEKMSEQLKRERLKYFPEKRNLGIGKRSIEEIENAPSAKYFSDSAQRFRAHYIKSHKFEMDIRMLIAFVCEQYKLTVDQLMSKSRKMPLPMARKYLSFFMYYYFEMTQEDIAKYLNRERSTITTNISYAIGLIEAYANERFICKNIDKFLFGIMQRRKQYEN